MTIKYKSKDGQEATFHFSWDMIQEFCAMDQCHSFYDETPSWYDDWDDPDKRPVAESRILRKILEEQASPGTNIFMGDRKGGPGDRLLFAYVPKRPFVVGNIRFKPRLSAYKRNPNSGHDCRFLILETEAAKPKSKKKEKAA